MHFKITFSIAVLAVLLISCKKEPAIFPDNADLKGCWDQITDEFYLDGEGLCFNGQETLFYWRRASRAVQADTFIYQLNEIEARLYLSPLSPPGGSVEGSYKIQLNVEKNELSIWGLYSSFPGETKFKKLW
jgi:hypothetical protein